MLLGDSCTGKTFCLEVLRKVSELILVFAKENWHKIDAHGDFIAQFEEFLLNSNKTPQAILMEKLYLNKEIGDKDNSNKIQTKKFGNNQWWSEIQAAWERLSKKPLEDGLDKWLIIDGIVNESNIRFLEKVRNVTKQNAYSFISISEDKNCQNNCVDNKEIKIIIETDQAKYFSPKICLEYPILYFSPNMNQATNLLENLLKLPREDWIAKGLKEFIKFIFIPLMNHFIHSRNENKLGRNNNGTKKYKLKKIKIINS